MFLKSGRETEERSRKRHCEDSAKSRCLHSLSLFSFLKNCKLGRHGEEYGSFFRAILVERKIVRGGREARCLPNLVSVEPKPDTQKTCGSTSVQWTPKQCLPRITVPKYRGKGGVCGVEQKR